jgi:ceramide glucosyltransferase
MAAAFELATMAAVGYAAVALVCVVRFGARKSEPEQNAVLLPVSLLVPLHGAEPELADNLSAFAAQDYPEVQLIFGVARADDPALPIARAVAAAFPDRHIDINVGEVAGARNPKIANVLSLARLVRHPVLILADSDTRAEPSYVRSVAAQVLAPGVGVVTCPFAGVPDRTFASKLGAMFMNEQFVPSVLVNHLFGHPRHCLGPTNALRASVLASIGGFEALAPHLADDFMLGNLIAARGLRVALSRYVVRTIVTDANLATLWDHELRWHRTIRSVRPAGYVGMVLTYPLPLALLALLLAPKRRRATFWLLLAALTRVTLGRASSRALGVPPAAPWLALPRDLFGFAVWLRGLTGTAVRWRGADLRLESGDLLSERAS